MDRLEEMVYLAIGRAQMCWKEFPSGAPDDDRACEVGKQLIAAIREYKQEETDKPTQQPVPTFVPCPVYPYNPWMPQWTCDSKDIKVIWSART